MPLSITPIFDGQIITATSTFTDWFENCHFLIFQSNDVGEYLNTNKYIEVAVALYAKVSSAFLADNIERQIDEFQPTINTHDLITVPELFRNDCFPMRLLINPSTGFHARILAISC